MARVRIRVSQPSYDFLPSYLTPAARATLLFHCFPLSHPTPCDSHNPPTPSPCFPPATPHDLRPLLPSATGPPTIPCGSCPPLSCHRSGSHHPSAHLPPISLLEICRHWLLPLLPTSFPCRGLSICRKCKGEEEDR